MEEFFVAGLIILFFAASTGSRCTSADMIDCGLNEVNKDNACVCDTGYIRSYTGNCDQCAVGFLQSSDKNGKMVCVNAEGDKRELKEDFGVNKKLHSAMSSNYDVNNETAMFKNYKIFDNGSQVKSADQFRKEGHNVPGFYPAFNNYKQYNFSTKEEIAEDALKAATRKDWTAYMNKTSVNATPLHLNETRYANPQYIFQDDKGVLDMPFTYGFNKYPLPILKSKFKVDKNNTGPVDSAPNSVIGRGKQTKYNDGLYDRSSRGMLPEPENPIKNDGVQNVAADYAISSMGLKFNNPEGQITTYANGDVMTSYKPINELMRPIPIPQLTERKGETENTYTPIATSSILAPPIPIEELQKKRKNGEELGVIPFPDSGSYIPQNPRSEIPQKNVGDTLQGFFASNPFFENSGYYNSRREMTFRNKREAIIPNTVGNPYYGDFIKPMENISNSNQFFFNGSGGIRDVTNRDDRDNSRILAEPRPAMRSIEGDQIRNIPNRQTTNKTNNDFEKYDLRTYLDLPNQQPTRSSVITSQNQRLDNITYKKPFINPPTANPERDSLTIGPPMHQA